LLVGSSLNLGLEAHSAVWQEGIEKAGDEKRAAHQEAGKSLIEAC
jgi:hypothetical protein